MAEFKEYWQVPKERRAKYRGAYKRGWNYSGNLDIPNHAGLDGNPFGDRDLYWSWESGYLDAATDREYGHRLEEHDHNLCP